MRRTYTIQQRDGDRWHADLGEATGWPSMAAARRAIRSLRSLGPEYLGEYRIVHEHTGGIVAGVTLRRTRAEVEAAKALGRLGGQRRSPAKAEAARRNGRLGGRPRKADVQP